MTVPMTPAYIVNTPGPGFYAGTLAEAKRKAHAGLDSIAAKRGYSMVETKRRDGNTVYHYITVYNSKGKVVTGAVIYKGYVPVRAQYGRFVADSIKRRALAQAARRRAQSRAATMKTA